MNLKHYILGVNHQINFQSYSANMTNCQQQKGRAVLVNEHKYVFHLIKVDRYMKGRDWQSGASSVYHKLNHFIMQWVEM